MITKEDKELIFKQYMDWVDEVTEDLDDKCYFSPEEIVYKVMELVEKHIEEMKQWHDFLKKDLGDDD